MAEFKELLDATSLISFDEFVKEEYVFKVHADKSKERRLKCPPGYKAEGGKCVPMSSETKRNIKIGRKKAVKTFKAAGATAAKKKNLRRNKALKARRDLYGL